MDMSKPQGPELHLNVSTLQRPLHHLNVYMIRHWAFAASGHGICGAELKKEGQGHGGTLEPPWGMGTF
jgi:hypothetical protein